MYCKNCGQVIDDKAEICPKCGVRISMPPTIQEKRNSGLAAILSFLVPGLGQIYCGRIGRGILILITTIILMLIVIGIVEWVWNIYDAYAIAEKINSGIKYENSV